MYWKYPKERFVGYYLLTTPLLILRDPELVKRVLVSDFAYFYSRSMHPIDKVPEPMMNNLFSCGGDLWRLLRQRITPAFTSGKLKAMFPLIISRAEKLQLVAAEATSTNIEVDARDLMARYTTDFIGACGFGIDTDTLNDENSMFRKLGHRIFKQTTRDVIATILKYMIPRLFTSLTITPPEVTSNTISLVQTIMKQRNYKPSGRNDFIDMLLELKLKGKITGDSIERKNPDGSPCIVEIEFDDLLIAAQVFMFFAAGFETSSSATSYTLHELAHYPECQRKCQKEIDEVLSRYDNKLSYEALKEMKYLNMCFSESLRVFPSVGYLIRTCEKPYTIPDTNITIDKGVKVIIPVKSLHADPLYWDKPEEFRPERFHPDNATKINKHVYVPFGDGPRACIGERLGQMQSLAGLAAILSQFSVAPSKNTIRRPIVDTKVMAVQSILGGIPLALIARKKTQ
ncbi:cytochrome P450 6B7-like [Choristoneura fumiferana]|uniref:cytochrome P450 6B7-like n=1 Tax=Choristoneura fumiferana TaxID=7141 RepID=UPI003D15C9CD